MNALPAGETSQYVYIFTKDLGLVGAHAQNTRNINSKLRYALNVPAKSHVSLVRGKNVWRLISAIPDKQLYIIFKNSPEKLKVCANVFSLLKKLLAGEEANPELFSLVDSFLIFLQTDLSDEEIKNAETIFLIRMLSILGYMPDNDIVREFAFGDDWNTEIIMKITSLRKEAVKIINESLRATDL